MIPWNFMLPNFLVVGSRSRCVDEAASYDGVKDPVHDLLGRLVELCVMAPLSWVSELAPYLGNHQVGTRDERRQKVKTFGVSRVEYAQVSAKILFLAPRDTCRQCDSQLKVSAPSCHRTIEPLIEAA
jgi:hypothetical protein